MIEIKTDIGGFTLDNGEFVKGNKTLRKIFDIETVRDIGVFEGDTDYAIYTRMKKYFNQSEIVNHKPDKEINMVVN